MQKDTGAWTRTHIAKHRVRQTAADRDREERMAHHTKYGNGEFEFSCDQWCCNRRLRGEYERRGHSPEPGEYVGTE